MQIFIKKRSPSYICYIDLGKLFSDPVGTILGPTGLGLTGGGGPDWGKIGGDIVGAIGNYMGQINAGNLAGAGLQYMGSIAAGNSAVEAQKAANIANMEEAIKNREFQREMFYNQASINATEAEKNRQFQAEQERIQQAYNTQMSNSAYQRATADMKAAGINPMLAYMQGGAGTPNLSQASGAQGSVGSVSGAQARIQPTTAQAEFLERAIRNSVNTALEGQMLKKELESKDSIIALNNQAKANQAAQTALNNATAAKKVAETIGVGLENTRLKMNLPKIKEENKREIMAAAVDQNPFLMYSRKILDVINPLSRLRIGGAK